MERETRGPRIGLPLVKSKSFKFWETESHATVLNSYRHGRTARPRERRHRPDGAKTIFEGAHPRSLRPHPLLRLALSPPRETKSGICFEFPAPHDPHAPPGS